MFYLTHIIDELSHSYSITISNNTHKHIIKINYLCNLCIINSYNIIKYNNKFIYSQSFNKNNFHELPDIFNYSIPDNVWYGDKKYNRTIIIKKCIYLNHIKPLLDSIILKKRLYELFIFKLVFKDKLTNDIYQHAIRFL
jgi:hypothetical protein